MKLLTIAIVAAVLFGVLALAIVVYPAPGTAFGLMTADTEFHVIVLDKDTALPIPDASVRFFDSEYRFPPDEPKEELSLTTDQEGRAVFFKKDARGESIGCFRENMLGFCYPTSRRVFMDPPFRSVRVKARGYMPYMDDLRYDGRYEDLGRDDVGRFQRFEFSLFMEKFPK